MNQFSHAVSSTSDPLKTIHYLNEGEIVPIPEWAQFCIEVGRYISSSPPSSTRRVAGLVLPTRSFASSLIATGVVVATLKQNSDPTSDAEYFEQLCSLKTGTNVKFLDYDKKGRSRVLDGVIMGCAEIRASVGGVQTVQRTLKVQLERASMEDPRAGGRTQFVMESNARKIRLAEGDTKIDVNNLPAQQNGTVLTPSSEFAKCIIGADGISDFTKESRLSCLIVGPLSQLRAEVQSHEFSVTARESRSGLKFADGMLLDLLRVRKFTSSGKAFRSEAFASNSRRPPSLTGNAVPEVVIFDGALGFLKWRDSFRSSHWVVLLDQTEVRFSEGVQTLNNCYLQRSGDDSLPESIPAPPAGTEFIYYQENAS